jgi:hypothetical protein
MEVQCEVNMMVEGNVSVEGNISVVSKTDEYHINAVVNSVCTYLITIFDYAPETVACNIRPFLRNQFYTRSNVYKTAVYNNIYKFLIGINYGMMPGMEGITTGTSKSLTFMQLILDLSELISSYIKQKEILIANIYFQNKSAVLSK